MIGFNMFDNVKIGIAGAGGLGSNCAVNLLRCGFSNLKIIDYDVVEKSNLNRQFYFYDQIGIPKVFALYENLKRINSSSNIEVFNKKIEENNINSFFYDCDAVVEAFDNVLYKKIIIDKFCTDKKLLVAASGIAGFGGFDKIKVKKLNDTFYIVGDFESETSIVTPPFSPKVNIAAALEADIVLSYFKGVSYC